MARNERRPRSTSRAGDAPAGRRDAPRRSAGSDGVKRARTPGRERRTGDASPIVSGARPPSLDALGVWSPPTWRAARPDAEGFWETRTRSGGAGSVDRLVVYVSAGELRFGRGDGVAQLEESSDREWRGPIVP